MLDWAALGGNRQEDDGPVRAYLAVASDNEIENRDADPRNYAAGGITSVDRALALRQIDVGNRDPAVSWAVAVYQAEPAPE